MTALSENIASVPQPPYLRIQTAIRARIVGGDWAAGEALPSRRQLCAEFGTTRVTLDKAIAGLEREGLLRSSRGSGTFVAEVQPPAAPGGRDGVHSAVRTLRIGIVLGHAASAEAFPSPTTENYYFGPLFQGVRDAFAGQRVETIYAHQDQTSYRSFFAEAGLDGMILTTPLLDELGELHALTDAGVPYVAAGISSRTAADIALPCVDSDNCQGGYDAVRYLIGLGHRHIGLVNLATSQANHHDRMEGFCLAMTEAGLSVRPGDLLLYPIHQSDRLEERIDTWLIRAESASDRPTAIFCTDYQMTLATLRVLRQHTLRVPDDVSLVGFDDPYSAAHLTPALTTVRQPVYQVGRRAAERLLQSLRADDIPRGTEMLPTQLIVRDSARSIHSHSQNEKEGSL